MDPARAEQDTDKKKLVFNASLVLAVSIVLVTCWNLYDQYELFPELTQDLQDLGANDHSSSDTAPQPSSGAPTAVKALFYFGVACIIPWMAHTAIKEDIPQMLRGQAWLSGGISGCCCCCGACVSCCSLALVLVLSAGVAVAVDCNVPGACPLGRSYEIFNDAALVSDEHAVDCLARNIWPNTYHSARHYGGTLPEKCEPLERAMLSCDSSTTHAEQAPGQNSGRNSNFNFGDSGGSSPWDSGSSSWDSDSRPWDSSSSPYFIAMSNMSWHGHFVRIAHHLPMSKHILPSGLPALPRNLPIALSAQYVTPGTMPEDPVNACKVDVAIWNAWPTLVDKMPGLLSTLKFHICVSFVLQVVASAIAFYVFYVGNSLANKMQTAQRNALTESLIGGPNQPQAGYQQFPPNAQGYRLQPE